VYRSGQLFFGNATRNDPHRWLKHSTILGAGFARKTPCRLNGGILEIYYGIYLYIGWDFASAARAVIAEAANLAQASCTGRLMWTLP
jgi:hypothetical protein